MKKIFPILGLAILLSVALIAFALTTEKGKDPVCGMDVDAATATYKIDSPHGAIAFCSQSCLDKFKANPSAYMKSKSSAGHGEKAKADDCGSCEGKEKAAAQAATTKSACGSCEDHGVKAASAKTEACDGKCGKTKVSAINQFHELMPKMEAGGVAAIKTHATELATRKAAVMKANCPEGVCGEGFGAARAAFGQKVDALVAAVETNDDTKIASAFDEMHKAYEALDMLSR